jgi:hypothetical protein
MMSHVTICVVINVYGFSHDYCDIICLCISSCEISENNTLINVIIIQRKHTKSKCRTIWTLHKKSKGRIRCDGGVSPLLKLDVTMYGIMNYLIKLQGVASHVIKVYCNCKCLIKLHHIGKCLIKLCCLGLIKSHCVG